MARTPGEQLRNEVLFDATSGLDWDQYEGAYRVTGPTEWTDDMEGVYSKNNNLFVAGDAVSESIRQQMRDAGFNPYTNEPEPAVTQ